MTRVLSRTEELKQNADLVLEEIRKEHSTKAGKLLSLEADQKLAESQLKTSKDAYEEAKLNLGIVKTKIKDNKSRTKELIKEEKLALSTVKLLTPKVKPSEQKANAKDITL